MRQFMCYDTFQFLVVQFINNPAGESYGVSPFVNTAGIGVQ